MWIRGSPTASAKPAKRAEPLPSGWCSTITRNNSTFDSGVR
jgi:hypothetical protein